MRGSTTIIILACENGHQLATKPLPAIEDKLEAGEDPFSGYSNYCTDCGGEAVYRCGSCTLPLNQKVPTGDALSGEYSDLTLPDYCPNCGEAHSWISPVEGEEVRDGSFVDLDASVINGYFYQETVNEINRCYRVQANEATFVLYRKLLESLIYDILSLYYDPAEHIDLYYDTERNQKHQFSTLLQNLIERSDELDKFSDPVDDHEFHEQIRDFKENGDTSAHSKENLVTDDEVEESSEEASHVAKVLFDLRRCVAGSIPQQSKQER